MSDLENLGFEDGGKVSEGGEGVSEADMGNVKENIKKSKKVQAQIQAQSAHNNDLAHMLSIILKKITDDDIIKTIINLINEDIDILEIFSIFAPFFVDEIISDEKLNKYFVDLKPIDSVSGYSAYTKIVLNESKTLNYIEKNYFISIIYAIVLYFNVGDMKNLSQSDAEIKNKLLIGLENDIYNINS